MAAEHGHQPVLPGQERQCRHPTPGAFSYYTDWQKDDEKLGRQKWQTFMLEELPPVIDAEFGTNKVQSIAAISMTGTSVLNYAIAKPGFYRSVGSFSGCAETATPAGQSFIQTVVGLRGGVDVTNMWGPLDGPGWGRTIRWPTPNACGARNCTSPPGRDCPVRTRRWTVSGSTVARPRWPTR